MVSPWFNRSAEGYGACLKFRYSLYGPGAESLRIFQKTDLQEDERPLWVDHNSTYGHWRYGQVSVSSVNKYQVTRQFLIIPVAQLPFV